MLLITHYTRILRYIEPDFVHVFVDGRIVEEGGPELADRLEAEGYDRFAGGRTPDMTLTPERLRTERPALADAARCVQPGRADARCAVTSRS